MVCPACCYFFFFFNDTATTEIYTLSLHDALPIYGRGCVDSRSAADPSGTDTETAETPPVPLPQVPPLWRLPLCVQFVQRSEEHTSELQSRQYLVCRLLLEKKKTIQKSIPPTDQLH